MTDFRLWAPAVPGPVASVDDVPANLGTEWQVTGPGPYWLKGISYWRADAAQDGAISVQAWTVTGPGAGTLLAGSQATPPLGAPGAWTEHIFDTPIPLTIGQRYRVSTHAPSGFVATGNYWDTGAGAAGITSGPLNAPNQGNATDLAQGSFVYNAGAVYPSSPSFNAGNYWVQPIITDIIGDNRTANITGTIGLIGEPTAEKAGVSASVGTIGLVGTQSVDQARAENIALPIGVALQVTATASAAGAAPRSAVLCSSWANPEDVPAAWFGDAPGATPEQKAAAWRRVLLLASELLWAMSGRVWYGGGCTETAQLRSHPPGAGNDGWPYDPSWGNCGCWSGLADMSWNGTDMRFGDVAQRHVRPFAIHLPRAPITVVDSVLVDGVPFTNWRLTRSGWLERLDGAAWNMCNDSTLVTYRWGVPPPEGGVQAAIRLAHEILLDEIGSDACQLPARLQSITRQGISMAVLDPMDFLRQMRTGLAQVDLWLAAVNPDAKQARGSVWWPEKNAAARYP